MHLEQGLDSKTLNRHLVQSDAAQRWHPCESSLDLRR